MVDTQPEPHLGRRTAAATVGTETVSGTAHHTSTTRIRHRWFPDGQDSHAMQELAQLIASGEVVLSWVDRALQHKPGPPAPNKA